MLYPDFNDLMTYKYRKSGLIHPSNRLVKTTVSGNHHSPFRGQGLEFDSVREYVPGDDIRCIDWRVTARTGSPHLKVFKEDRERHISICVDLNAAMRFGTRNTFKSIQAARIAALLGWQAIASQDRVSACLFGDVANGIQYFAPKRSSNSFCAMLKLLAEKPKESHFISLANVMQHINKTSHTGSLIYFISDFLEVDESFKQDASLNRLCKNSDIVFISINDPADKSISPSGMINFSENGKNVVFANTEIASSRKAYVKQWEANRLFLSEVCARLKISMIELTTESDISKDLVTGLKSIAKRKKR